jgi:membrane protein required for colicin V production
MGPFMGLNWLDLVMVGVMGLSGLVGLMRGLLREILSLMTWAVAIWAGIRFSQDLALLLDPLIPSPTARIAAAFGILFIITLIMAGMFGYLMGRILDTAGLSGVDRSAGLLFGVARGILILTVAVFLSRSTPFPKESVWQSSQLIPIFQSLAIWMEAQIPPGLLPRLGEQSLSH